MSYERLAELVLFLWLSTAVGLFLLNFLNLPLLTAFVLFRRVDLLRADAHLRPNAPTRASFHFVCALIYGIIQPIFYFLAVRTRHQLWQWNLGSVANQWWTITLGVICVGWLLAHWCEALLRPGRLRYSSHPANKAIAALGLGLCLWYHVMTASPLLTSQVAGAAPGFGRERILFFLFYFLYPQSCFLGATLVYGGALAETLRLPADPFPPRRRWRLAASAAALVILILFAPFWLSIPRVSRGQALRLLDENREAIIQTSREAQLDPRLLAGIIYVAQTRDNPRWTGRAVERVGLAGWENRGVPGVQPLIEPSCGLCQIKPATAALTMYYYHLLYPQFGNDPSASTSFFSYWSGSGPPPFAAVWGASTNRLRDSGRLDPMGKRFNTAFTTGQWKEVIVNEEASLAIAAVMLVLMESQWAEAGYPIHDRPEILATLYNLGYQRSNPHATPRANDFGRRVKKFMDSDACRKWLGDTDETGS